MSHYTIKFDYSFHGGTHVEREQQNIYLVWEDIEQAKEALARIKDQIEAVRNDMSYDEVRNQPWYSGPLTGDVGELWKYWVVVTQSDGKAHALSAFWLTKGVVLHTAEVCLYEKEVTPENGMKFLF